MRRERVILSAVLVLLILAIAAALTLRTRQRATDDARDLGALLAFADPAECRPGPALARLLDGLFLGGNWWDEPRAGPPIVVPGFAQPLRPHLERRFAVGRDAMGLLTYAALDIRGRWHGLAVVELRRHSGDDLEIRFAEPPAKVRDTLVRAGFPLPPAGQWRQPDYTRPMPSPIMGVESHGGGASLICAGS